MQRHGRRSHHNDLRWHPFHHLRIGHIKDNDNNLFNREKSEREATRDQKTDELSLCIELRAGNTTKSYFVRNYVSRCAQYAEIRRIACGRCERMDELTSHIP